MLTKKVFRLQKHDRLQACKIPLLAKAHWTQEDVKRGLGMDVAGLTHDCRGKLRISVEPKILIVMRNLLRAASLAVVLQNNGCRVIVSPTGFDAYTKYLRHGSHEFSLVLCEWYLPGIAGRDLAFYESQAGGTLLFVAILNEGENAADAIRSGADLFFRAPMLPHLTYILSLVLPSEMQTRIMNLVKIGSHHSELKGMFELILDNTDHYATDEKLLVEMVRADLLDGRDIVSVETGKQMLDNVILGMKAMKASHGHDDVVESSGNMVDNDSFKKACKALRGIVGVFNEMKRDIFTLQDQNRSLDNDLKRRDPNIKVEAAALDNDYAALKSKGKSEDIDQYVKQLNKKLLDATEINVALKEHLDRSELYRVQVEEEIMSNGLMFNFQEFNVTYESREVKKADGPALSPSQKALQMLNKKKSTADIQMEESVVKPSKLKGAASGLQLARKMSQGVSGAATSSSTYRRGSERAMPRTSFVAQHAIRQVRLAVDEISRLHEVSMMIREDKKTVPLLTQRITALVRPPEQIIKDPKTPLDALHNSFLSLMTAVAVELNSFNVKTTQKAPQMLQPLQELVKVLTSCYNKVNIKQLVTAVATEDAANLSRELGKVKAANEKQLETLEVNRVQNNNDHVQKLVRMKLDHIDYKHLVARYVCKCAHDIFTKEFLRKWQIWLKQRRLNRLVKGTAEFTTVSQSSKQPGGAGDAKAGATTPQTGKAGRKESIATRDEYAMNLRIQFEEEKENHRSTMKYLNEARVNAKKRIQDLEAMTKDLASTKKANQDQAAIILSFDVEVTVARQAAAQVKGLKDALDKANNELAQTKNAMEREEVKNSREKMEMLVRQSEQLKIKFTPKAENGTQATAETLDQTTQSLPIAPQIIEKRVEVIVHVDSLKSVKEDKPPAEKRGSVLRKAGSFKSVSEKTRKTKPLSDSFDDLRQSLDDAERHSPPEAAVDSSPTHRNSGSGPPPLQLHPTPVLTLTSNVDDVSVSPMLAPGHDSNRHGMLGLGVGTSSLGEATPITPGLAHSVVTESLDTSYSQIAINNAEHHHAHSAGHHLDQHGNHHGADHHTQHDHVKLTHVQLDRSIKDGDRLLIENKIDQLQESIHLKAAALAAHSKDAAVPAMHRPSLTGAALTIEDVEAIHAQMDKNSVQILQARKNFVAITALTGELVGAIDAGDRVAMDNRLTKLNGALNQQAVILNGGKLPSEIPEHTTEATAAVIAENADLVLELEATKAEVRDLRRRSSQSMAAVATRALAQARKVSLEAPAAVVPPKPPSEGFQFDRVNRLPTYEAIDNSPPPPPAAGSAVAPSWMQDPTPPKQTKPVTGPSPRVEIVRENSVYKELLPEDNLPEYQPHYYFVPATAPLAHKYAKEVEPAKPTTAINIPTAELSPGPARPSAKDLQLDGLVRQLHSELQTTGGAYKSAVRDSKKIKAANLDRHNHATIASMLMMSQVKQNQKQH